MSAALAELPDAKDVTHLATSIMPTPAASPARAEASRANGRKSRGPTSPEGKARSRKNGCKEGLTGAGVVLPPAAAEEVERREREFIRDLRPRNEVERELVRQIALGAWRQHELCLRIIRHDAETNAARFANWEQDELVKVAEIGRRLADDPQAAVAQLQRSSSGCDWLIERWRLLGNALGAAEDSPRCDWSEADVTLILNLLSRPAELRHLDDWTGWLEGLCTQARSGSDEAVGELRAMIDEQVEELERRSDEVWQSVEQPAMQGWLTGASLDLGPEGTRLRRYEAAADRLFRSAWTKLEKLRAERGRPMIGHSAYRHEPEPLPRTRSAEPPEPAAPPASAPAVTVAPAAARPRLEVPASTLRDDPSPVLDLYVAGRPGNADRPGFSLQNKANPAPGLISKGGLAAALRGKV